MQVTIAHDHSWCFKLSSHIILSNLIRSMVNSTNRPGTKMKKHNFSISAFLIYAEANFFSSSSPERKWIIEKGARKIQNIEIKISWIFLSILNYFHRNNIFSDL